MRRSKALAAVAVVGLLGVAAACGGGGDDGDNGENPGASDTFSGQEGGGKNPDATGAAPEIEGATDGGTVTVYLPGDPGPDSLDPTDGWSVTGNSIMQDLAHRSLTTYRKAEDGSMELVPDLATDLGTPNDDFTEWTFTLKDGLKWSDGSPITAEQVAFGIQRSYDSKAFPAGPGTEYTNTYFAQGGEYEGPYSDPNGKFNAVTVDGNDITIKMKSTFPDMDYWGAFEAMGPVPTGNASKPPKYGLKPLTTGPYKIDSYDPGSQLVLSKNENWDPESDPARHQYVDKWIFKFNADPEQSDQVLLSGNQQSQTAISTQVQSSNYAEAKETLGDRLVRQSSQCTSFLYPDYDATDINVRKALAYAYPYEDVWLATGELPGVTRVPANSIMPPGMAGKNDYFVDGEQITYDPDKAKEYLAKAGYADKPYPIKMIYYEVDPNVVAGQKQITKAFDDAGFKVQAVPTQDDPYDTWTNPDDKLNKSLNLRQVNWCSDWPSGLTMIPPLIKTGAAYNTGHFSESSVDDQMAKIPTMDLEEQPDAWGELDKNVAEEYYPIIPTAFRNDLFGFGESIGNPGGDGQIGAPNYRDIYVAQ